MSSKENKSKSKSSSSSSSSTKRSSTKRSSTKRSSTKRSSAKDDDAPFTMTPKVQAAIERQNAEDDAAEAERKKTLKERVAKMAGVGGAAPGFATAGIGAQIAQVTAKRGKDGKRMSVKAVIRDTERVAAKKAPKVPKQ
jgi:hypothetical protein